MRAYGTIAVAADYRREEIEAQVREKFGKAFFDKYCLEASAYPHYIFPGYYALFQWIHAQGGKLFFFSSGIESRNVELAEKLLKASFGEKYGEIPYQVFSRHHCIDTTRLDRALGDEEYQSFFYGQKKKKLAGIVVPEEEISQTLLIEDDSSYMVKGEEYNIVRVRYPIDYLPNEHFKDAFVVFHRAYYLAGILEEILETSKTKDITLVEAAKVVQVDNEGAVLNRDFYYPGMQRTSYFTRGLEILQKFDQELKFYYEVP